MKLYFYCQSFPLDYYVYILGIGEFQTVLIFLYLICLDSFLSITYVIDPLFLFISFFFPLAVFSPAFSPVVEIFFSFFRVVIFLFLVEENIE